MIKLFLLFAMVALAQLKPIKKGRFSRKRVNKNTNKLRRNRFAMGGRSDSSNSQKSSSSSSSQTSSSSTQSSDEFDCEEGRAQLSNQALTESWQSVPDPVLADSQYTVFSLDPATHQVVKVSTHNEDLSTTCIYGFEASKRPTMFSYACEAINIKNGSQVLTCTYSPNFQITATLQNSSHHSLNTNEVHTIDPPLPVLDPSKSSSSSEVSENREQKKPSEGNPAFGLGGKAKNNHHKRLSKTKNNRNRNRK